MKRCENFGMRRTENMPRVNIGKIKLNYEIDGEGEAVVFIHGLGSSLEDWELQKDSISKKHQVIRYDVRGHGESDKPNGKYSVKLFSEDLANLLDALGLKTVHLVGLSMGGWIAFQLCVDYPDRVKNMTIVNSGPALIFDTFEKKKELYLRLILFSVFGMRKIGEILAPRLFIKPEQEDLRNDFVERWAQNYKPSYMASFRGAVGWSVMDEIGEIECPVLVVAADEDYTPVSDKEAFVAKLQNGKLKVLEDSRHATPIEKPEEFNHILIEFLDSL